jgi:hypothetical protein
MREWSGATTSSFSDRIRIAGNVLSVVCSVLSGRIQIIK